MGFYAGAFSLARQSRRWGYGPQPDQRRRWRDTGAGPPLPQAQPLPQIPGNEAMRIGIVLSEFGASGRCPNYTNYTGYWLVRGRKVTRRSHQNHAAPQPGPAGWMGIFGLRKNEAEVGASWPEGGRLDGCRKVALRYRQIASPRNCIMDRLDHSPGERKIARPAPLQKGSAGDCGGSDRWEERPPPPAQRSTLERTAALVCARRQ